MSFFQGTNGVSIGQGTFNAVTGNQRQKKKRTVYDEFPDIQRGFVRRLEDLDHKDRLLGWNSRLRKYEAKIHDDSSSNNIYNHYTISKREKKNRRIYDEFPDIQRGLVRRLKDLDHKDCLLRWNSRLRKCEVRVKGTISTVKIHGDSSSFTVMPYKGQDAQKVWKKEFQQFSETTNTTKIQLFGINRSRIPLLIFHGELVPLAHLWDRLGRSYAYELAYNMECKESEMWIDPAQGTLIRGAERPDFDLLDRFRFPPIGTLPSTVELLDENVCFRYFSRLPLDKEFDKGIIHMLHYASKIEEKISSIISKPCVFSSKTNPMIAVGRGQWRVFGCLNHSGVAMPDGRTRFTITDESSELSFHSDTFGDMRAWLSQASSVFNRLGISLDEELSSYARCAIYRVERINQELQHQTPTMLRKSTHLFLPPSAPFISARRWFSPIHPHLVL
ncbi:hypothetical protein E1B28_004984 [Marasmius oreades]|uniref:Uncharacterized protein n=1 Tax=Marasmius oreades TaxID=181124 RepID=A0A9P7UZP1_9AGAR|nr:uncharacterized protein E1B28_004984 [Marasmius oreades]KAG7097656.1 hypothetical protein E1B28_004984 [Marasmius oreades]